MISLIFDQFRFRQRVSVFVCSLTSKLLQNPAVKTHVSSRTFHLKVNTLVIARPTPKIELLLANLVLLSLLINLINRIPINSNLSLTSVNFDDDFSGGSKIMGNFENFGISDVLSNMYFLSFRLFTGNYASDSGRAKTSNDVFR